MKKSFTLHVLESECSRRTLLQGLGAATAIAMLPSCAQQGSDLPSATQASCNGGVCIDLTASANAPLTQIGGAMLVDAAGDTIMVIRASTSQVIALSAICTHAGCSMNFDSSSSQITCPCHGSVFAEDGSVVSGPARRPLKIYTATLANNTITVAA